MVAASTPRSAEGRGEGKGEPVVQLVTEEEEEEEAGGGGDDDHEKLD